MRSPRTTTREVPACRKYRKPTQSSEDSALPKYINILFHDGLGASLVAQLAKNLPAVQETPVQPLGWEDPLQKGKATPLQYSGLENSEDCIVHGVTKSGTQLGDYQSHIHVTVYPWTLDSLPCSTIGPFHPFST